MFETNNEINKYIDEHIMGKLRVKVPDYCSDESPRSLLTNALRKVNTTGTDALVERLDELCGEVHSVSELFLCANDLARICVEAHQQNMSEWSEHDND